MNLFETNLQNMGVVLQEPPASVGSFLPYVISGSLVFLSGQLPLREDGSLAKGRLGEDATLEQGQEAARLCMIMVLVHLKKACRDDLGRVKKAIKIGGFVNSTPDFDQYSKVINGASDFLKEVMGTVGEHARFALGVSGLPLHAMVEMDAIFEICV